MALNAGRRYARLNDIPFESQPKQPIADLAALAGGQGSRPAARTGSDGTRWCIACYFTLPADGQQTFCEQCARRRDSLRRRDRRQVVADTTVQVPLSTLRELLTITRNIEVGIGQVLAASHEELPIERPAMNLTASAKKLSSLMLYEIEPRLLPTLQQRRRP